MTDEQAPRPAATPGFQLTASLGSVHTIVVHPPATTHRQLDDTELLAAGIAPGLLRCSVGLEDLEDLVEDFGHGLVAARAAVRTRITTDVPAGEPEPVGVTPG